MFTSVFVLSLVIGAVLCDDEQAKLRLYYGSFENYTELAFDESHNLFTKSWYNSSRPTNIFCHGFTGYPNDPPTVAVIKAYLEQGQSNVALLNWDRLAAQKYISIVHSYLTWAVPNAIKLGADFADVLLKLSAGGLNLKKTHLVGHSLGAHVVGITGNTMASKGVQFPWITGLDPAGPVFDAKLPNDRLNPNSAGFVDVIHSDPVRYGSKIELGTVDFWPNYRNFGLVVQPGCDGRLHPRLSLEDLCNHHKSWQFFADSIKYPGSLMGSYATSFWAWTYYSKQQRLATVLEIGKYYENVVPGKYYLTTAASSPYGLAENGL